MTPDIVLSEHGLTLCFQNRTLSKMSGNFLQNFLLNHKLAVLFYCTQKYFPVIQTIYSLRYYLVPVSDGSKVAIFADIIANDFESFLTSSIKKFESTRNLYFNASFFTKIMKLQNSF